MTDDENVNIKQLRRLDVEQKFESISDVDLHRYYSKKRNIDKGFLNDESFISKHFIPIKSAILKYYQNAIFQDEFDKYMEHHKCQLREGNKDIFERYYKEVQNKKYDPEKIKESMQHFFESNKELFVPNDDSNDLGQYQKVKEDKNAIENSTTEKTPPKVNTKPNTITSDSKKGESIPPTKIPNKSNLPITQNQTLPQTNVVKDLPKPPEKKIREYNLPNGMVDSKYEEKIQLPKNINISKVTPNWDDSFGVTFDKEMSKLTGIPTKSGNYFIEFFYGDLGDSDKYKFTINPDPKKLWKDIPPPDNALFSTKSEFSECNKELKKIKIITASKRGRSHAHEGKFREDDSKIFSKEEDGFVFSILVVSDGAGSAKYSREGSRIVCDRVSGYFSSHYEEIKEMNLDGKETNEIKQRFLKPIREVVKSVRDSIEKTAEENKYEIKDFAATCLFLLYIEYPKSKKCLVVSFWIGDGAISIYDQKRKSVTLLGKPDSGQYSGETRFITSEIQDLFDRIHVEVIDPDFTALFLMTDGVSDPKFETDANLNDSNKWDSLWDELEKEKIFQSPEPDKALLKWLDFWSQGNHDDRTITILSTFQFGIGD